MRFVDARFFGGPRNAETRRIAADPTIRVHVPVDPERAGMDDTHHAVGVYRQRADNPRFYDWEGWR